MGVGRRAQPPKPKAGLQTPNPKNPGDAGFANEGRSLYEAPPPGAWLGPQEVAKGAGLRPPPVQSRWPEMGGAADSWGALNGWGARPGAGARVPSLLTTLWV